MQRLAIFLVGLALFLGTSGGTKAQSLEEGLARAKACGESVAADAVLRPLFVKLAPQGMPTSAQLADASIPTPDEARLVEHRSQRLEPCRGISLSVVRQYHPLLEPTYQLLYVQSDMIYLQLVRRQISYGNANGLLRDVNAEFDRRERAYVQMRTDELRREQAERDRQTAEEARRWRDSMRSSYSPPKVVVCSWRGSMLICI